MVSLRANVDSVRKKGELEQVGRTVRCRCSRVRTTAPGRWDKITMIGLDAVTHDLGYVED